VEGSDVVEDGDDEVVVYCGSDVEEAAG